MKKQLTFALALCLAIPLAAAAPKLIYDEDWDEVKAAIEKGYIRPYDELLTQIQHWSPSARIVKVELEEEDDIWLYEIKMLDHQRNVVKMDIDARTFRLLRVRGHYLEQFFSNPELKLDTHENSDR